MHCKKVKVNLALKSVLLWCNPMKVILHTKPAPTHNVVVGIIAGALAPGTVCPVVGGTTGVVYFGSDVFLRHLDQ